MKSLQHLQQEAAAGEQKPGAGRDDIGAGLAQSQKSVMQPALSRQWWGKRGRGPHWLIQISLLCPLSAQPWEPKINRGSRLPPSLAES